MKNKITLLVLAAFVILIVSVAGIRKIVLKFDRRTKLKELHPVLVFTLAMSDLTKLHKAALNNDARQTEQLIGQGWAVDRRVKGKLTPLHVASMSGSCESAAVLIEHGANVNFENREGVTPLAFAAIGAKRRMVEFLLANGASPDKKNKGGKTPADVAQEWRQKMVPLESSYYRIYGEQMDACIEILRQAEDKTTEDDPNNKADDQLPPAGTGSYIFTR
jgi:hypothetical protein